MISVALRATRVNAEILVRGAPLWQFVQQYFQQNVQQFVPSHGGGPCHRMHRAREVAGRHEIRRTPIGGRRRPQAWLSLGPVAWEAMTANADLGTLRQSNRFAATFDGAGRFVVYEIANPAHFVRLSDLGRAVLSCFPGSHDVPADVVIASVEAAQADGVGQALTPGAVRTVIADLRRHGMLVHGPARHGMYSREMVAAYVQSRPVPGEVGKTIASAAPITSDSKVLDIGSGTGTVAVELAAATGHVTCLDVSEEFLEAGRAAAMAAGRSIRFVNGSANHLMFSSHRYDVIVASQVLHWLDPSLAIRGIARALTPGGSLFAVESKVALPDGHPLRERLAYGAASPATVRDECLAHARRHACLVQAVSRRPLALRRCSIFRQHRAFDLEFARAYFFDGQLARAFAGSNNPWARLAVQFAALPAQALEGDMFWLVAQYADDRRASSSEGPSAAVEVAEDAIQQLNESMAQ